MIRQAQEYMHGAASGAALVAASVVAFVLLVWLSPLHGLPIPDFGFGADTVTPASERSADPTQSAPASTPGSAAGVRRSAAGRGGSSSSGTANQQGDGASTGSGDTTSHGDVAGNPGAGPAPVTTDRGDQPAPTGGGGSATGVEVGGTPVNSQSVSNAGHGAVDTVDQATGGALQQTGASDTAHDVIDSTIGPGTTAGSAADGALGAVGGALGGPPGKR